MTASGWDAVVLAGGDARRMGTDKLALDVGGRSMLDRVLDAVADADRVIVVGPRRDTDRPVVWCREDPPGTGPAAALAAGRAHVEAPIAVVVAGDQPLLTADLLARLRAAVDAGGAIAVDADGRPQWLCSAWRADALREAPLAAGGSLRRAFGALPWAAVPADPMTVFDCDTEQDLHRARELAG